MSAWRLNPNPIGPTDAAESSFRAVVGDLAALFVGGRGEEAACRLRGVDSWTALEYLIAVENALSEARGSVAAERAAVYRTLTSQYSIAQIAQRTGVSRQSVHQALARDAERRGKVNEQLI